MSCAYARAGRQAWLVINDVRKKEVVGYISALTPPILYFFRRRTRGEKAARQAVQGILRDFTIVPLTGEAIERGVYNTAS